MRPAITTRKYVSSVYVAASSKEMPRAKRVMELLRKSGLIVTSTWCEEIDKVGQANPLDASEDDRVRWSETDLNEVEAADCLLHLYPLVGSGFGSGVELGTMLTLRKHSEPSSPKFVISVGENRRSSIFTALADVQCDTDDEGIAAVVRLATLGVDA